MWQPAGQPSTSCYYSPLTGFRHSLSSVLEAAAVVAAVTQTAFALTFSDEPGSPLNPSHEVNGTAGTCWLCYSPQSTAQ